MPIVIVVSQHFEEATALRDTRTHLIFAPHVNVFDLSRLDEKLVAHLDGMAVAGDLEAKLADVTPGRGARSQYRSLKRVHPEPVEG